MIQMCAAERTIVTPGWCSDIVLLPIIIRAEQLLQVLISLENNFFAQHVWWISVNMTA